MRRRYSSTLLLTLALSSLAERLWAVDKEWNLAANGTWNTALNWSPNGIPATTDAVFLGRNPFPQGFLTTLDINATVASFTMRNGSDFSTGGSQLIVNGLATVAGTGSSFQVLPKASSDFDSLDTEGLLIENSGLVSMQGGIIEIESGALDITTGGTSGSGGLGGYGTIELVQTGLAGAQVFNNSGRLFVDRNAFALAGTLTITNTDTDNPLVEGDGSVDLDGDTEDGIVDVSDDPFGQSSNLTLVVDAQLTDDFGGEMQIGRGDTVDMRRAWAMSNVDLQLNGSSGTATLMGSTLTVSSGSNINVNSGVGHIASNLTVNAGNMSVASGTTLQLSGTANINSASALALIGTSTLHVTGSTSINDAGSDFDWDGGGGSTTRVSGNGRFDINVDNLDLGSDSFSGDIELQDSGDLEVTVADGQWEIVSTGSLVRSNSGISTVTGSELAVNGGLIDVQAGTLQISPNIEYGFGGSLVVDAGATARFLAQSEFMAGSLLLVNGTLDLVGTSTWRGPSLMSGSGTLSHSNSIVAENTTIAIETFDWDSGTTTVNAGRSLVLNVGNVDLSNDTFNGTATVNSGNLTVDVADDSWTIGVSGVVSLANTNGNQPTLNGDLVVLESGGVVQVSGGDADINAPISIRSTSEIVIQSGVTLQLFGATTLDGGMIRESNGVNATLGQFGAVTVTGDSTIQVDTYNWDQAPTTINSGATLVLNVTNLDAQAGERYDNVLTINSGSLNVTNSSGAWTVDDRIVLNNSTGVVPTVSGADLNIGDGVGSLDSAVRVNGSGSSTFDVDVDYLSDADVIVSSGAILLHARPTRILGGGSFGGSGTLNFGSSLEVDADTTFNMTAGSVDFDGLANDLAGNTMSINADLVVNVASLSPFGKTNVTGVNILDVDNTVGGTLTVNLTNPADAWRVNPAGRVNLTRGNAAATLLSGSDVDMDGELNIVGDVRTTARLLVGGNISVGTAGEPLRLEGGTLATPNRLEGGSISGFGILQSNAGHALHGFGSITTNVDFSGTAELKANDGELTVSATVLDVGEIGTSDVDGALNMVNAWNSSVATQVRLAGGVVRGGDITNDGPNGIRGYGEITARIVNNTSLIADGGTLISNNSASDYDGSTGFGLLDASNGNLEIRDNAQVGFGGTARVGNGRDGFAKGFRMNFSPGSLLQLTGGQWRSDFGMNVAGTLNVNAGAASTLIAGTDLTFVSGSTTTLLSNLRVSADPAIIQVGATFTGSGDLINQSNSALRLNNGAVVGVGIQNEGLLQIGTAAARGDAADFIQTSTGTVEINLGGTSLTDYDRLIMSGGAQLGGSIEVSLLNGFSPTLGNSFPVFTAIGGVTGTFNFESLPSLGNGLLLDVVYNPTSVVLEVIQGLRPDFDLDGDADGNDVDLLVSEIVGMSHGNLFDLTGDGSVNAADLTLWLDLAGEINLASGNPYLPGDANLDGVVDGSDFGVWNSNKFTVSSRWTQGDFSADGVVDGSDFSVWNSNKFTSSDISRVVPEPTSSLFGLLCLALLGRRRSAR